MSARIGIVTFPGTLDNQDAARAVRICGAQPVDLWHASDDLQGVDAIILPGGFSYGDYLRAGALAAMAPVMSSVVAAAGEGTPVLGICNGFQILCEADLLPGAMIKNAGLSFICKEQELVVENNQTAWTNAFDAGQHITVPLKNQDGQFMVTPSELARIEGEGLVVFRYVDNPNGSISDIAGITNSAGNVVGLMPHPEHAVETGFGPSLDGRGFIASALSAVLAHA